MMRHLVRGVIVAGLTAGLAWAEEGRIPLFQQTTITSPGSYVVTRDIDIPFPPPPPGPLITVSASPVDIDLNGYTLNNPDGPAISSSGSLLKIHNGKLFTGSAGPALQSTGDTIILKDLSVGGTGVLLTTPKKYVVEDLFASGLIVSDSDPNYPIQSGTIERSRLDVLNMAGITQGLFDVTVEGNTIGEMVFQAIQGLVVRNNHTTRINIGVFLSQHCVVEDNVVTGTAPDGILYTCDAGRIAGNVLTGARLNVAGNRNLIVDNVVSGAPGIGMIVTGRQNHVEGNLLSGNGSFGMLFDTASASNVYRRNTARGNAGVAGATCAAPCSPDFCDKGAGNTSNGDNFLPGPPTFPACK